EVAALAKSARQQQDPETRERFESALSEAILEKQAELAAEFDAVQTVERAKQVGSLEEIVSPADMRSFLVRSLRSGR
ncbi:MAG: hypothetical protein QNK04_23675, partial [Myxococcota bacterium]|nr:hypothetical protein [Myxococcota bacterium]